MINSLGLSLTSLQPLRQMALAHLQAQSWDEAGKSLRLLAAMAPDDAWCQQWLVVVAIAQHKPAEAIEAAEAALRALAGSVPGGGVGGRARSLRRSAARGRG